MAIMIRTTITVAIVMVARVNHSSGSIHNHRSIQVAVEQMQPQDLEIMTTTQPAILLLVDMPAFPVSWAEFWVHHLLKVHLIPPAVVVMVVLGHWHP